jgi:hypothetical protein
MTKVLVYLWFDVEDYVTPTADEPPKRIVDILSGHDVKATFKVVAEKLSFFGRKATAIIW